MGFELNSNNLGVSRRKSQRSRSDRRAGREADTDTRHADSRASTRPAGPSRILAALVVAVLLAYQPAWHGGELWDDDGHITKPELISGDGLHRIWFEIGATQQYYPVVHSAFWLFHQLWGRDTLGYHLVNIGLHALSGFLLTLLLRRLAVPGAVLAGILFALHPVHVESVAWITELKNTLSGVLYLAAALAYLRFDSSRRRAFHAVALALFPLALLAKSVTATLPAALLVVFWWKRGRLDWRRDVLPLVPFFVDGHPVRPVHGMGGAHVHRRTRRRIQFLIRRAGLDRGPSGLVLRHDARLARESPVHLSTLERERGRLVAIPVPRRRRRGARRGLAIQDQDADAAHGTASLRGDAVPGPGVRQRLSLQILVRRRSLSISREHADARADRRGPDDARPPSVRGEASRAWEPALVLIALVLGALTWRQSHLYVDAETLYRETIARNPGAWMAYNNLGSLKLLGSPDRSAEAAALVQEAIRLFPDNPEAHNNLGVAYQRMGRLADAEKEHREAIRLLPNYAEPYNNLGIVAEQQGRLDEAVGYYTRASSSTARRQPGEVASTASGARCGNWVGLTRRSSE